MGWELALGFVLLSCLGYLLWRYRREDRRRERMRVREALSPELRAELDAERNRNAALQQQFEAAMEKAKR